MSSTQYSIGGLVGYSTSGQIESSYYEGTISGTGNRYYGLLIGYGENNVIPSITKTDFYNDNTILQFESYVIPSITKTTLQTLFGDLRFESYVIPSITKTTL